MEQGYGGPVWHASAASPTFARATLELYARRMLDGVGDASLGEWVERDRITPRGWAVVHVRRRLTPAEADRVGPVRDIRGTPELFRRATATSELTGLPRDALLVMG